MYGKVSCQETKRHLVNVLKKNKKVLYSLAQVDKNYHEQMAVSAPIGALGCRRACLDECDSLEALAPSGFCA